MTVFSSCLHHHLSWTAPALIRIANLSHSSFLVFLRQLRRVWQGDKSKPPSKVFLCFDRNTLDGSRMLLLRITGVQRHAAGARENFRIAPVAPIALASEMTGRGAVAAARGPHPPLPSGRPIPIDARAATDIHPRREGARVVQSKVATAALSITKSITLRTALQ